MFEPQVRLDNICFNSIFYEDIALLVRAIFDEEVKDAVWSCDSLNSPDSNSFNLALFNFVGSA